MRAKILFLSLGTALAAAGLYSAFTARSARQAVEREIDRLRQRESRLNADTNSARDRLAALESERARVKGAIEAARRNPAKAAPAQMRPPEPVRPEIASLLEGLANDPRTQNLHLAEIRTRYAETYGTLFRQLNLTEAQAAQVVDNLLTRYEQRMDFGVAMGKLRRAANDAAVATTGLQQIEDAYRAKQMALLGPAAYEKLDFYDRTSGLRRFVDDFAGKTTVAGTPITEAQADALIEAMATANPLFQSGKVAQMEKIDWTVVLSRAAGELSVLQLAMLKNAAIPHWNAERLRELALKKQP